MLLLAPRSNMSPLVVSIVSNHHSPLIPIKHYFVLDRRRLAKGMALCQFCCSVTPHRLNDGVIAHHASWGALQDSAARGCGLCAFLQSILHSDLHTESGNVGGITIEAVGFNKPYLSRARVSLPTRSSTVMVTRENSKVVPEIFGWLIYIYQLPLLCRHARRIQQFLTISKDWSRPSLRDSLVGC